MWRNVICRNEGEETRREEASCQFSPEKRPLRRDASSSLDQLFGIRENSQYSQLRIPFLGEASLGEAATKKKRPAARRGHLWGEANCHSRPTIWYLRELTIFANSPNIASTYDYCDYCMRIVTKNTIAANIVNCRRSKKYWHEGKSGRPECVLKFWYLWSFCVKRNELNQSRRPVSTTNFYILEKNTAI